jgi:hypothetical protein
MSVLTGVMKNEYTGKLLDLTGVRKPPFVPDLNTKHYRCPQVEAGGGYVELKKYSGPQIPVSEWESLEYTTYKSDPFTFFAPITSPTGRIEMIGAQEAGKEELECVPTPNADKCPTIMAWLESTGARYGRVQLLRMKPNTLRECRWGLQQPGPPGEVRLDRAGVARVHPGRQQSAAGALGPFRPQDRVPDPAAGRAAGGGGLRAAVARRLAQRHAHSLRPDRQFRVQPGSGRLDHVAAAVAVSGTKYPAHRAL